MNLKNSNNWSSTPRSLAYVVAILITTAALAIRHLLHPYLEPYAPFQIFFISCLLTEYFVGLGPALLAMALSFVVGTYYFIFPYGTFGAVSRSDAIATINFVLITGFAIALVEYLKRTLYSKQLVLKILQSHHKISLFRENDRLYLAKKTATTVRTLDNLLKEFHKVLLLRLPDQELYPQALFYRLCPVQYGENDKNAWLALFHQDVHAHVQNEIALVEQGGPSLHTLAVPIRDGSTGYMASELILERISIGNGHLIAIILAKPTPPIELPLPASPKEI